MDEYERQVMEDLRRDIGRIVAEREALKAQRDALKAQVAECERVSLQRQFRVDEKVNGLTEQRDALLAALERKIARNATPAPVPAGSMILQPSDERRRSGQRGGRRATRAGQEAG